MSLTHLLALAQVCAPFVAPGTMVEVIRVESGGRPLATHVNGLPKAEQPPLPRDVAEAVRVASHYIGRGFTVDLGAMQINSRNLPALGLSLPMAFDTCSNLHGGAVILTANYLGAAATYGPGLTALQVALSLYNTGSWYKGFNNGYVSRYFPPGSFALPVVARARDLPRKIAAAGAPDAPVSR